MTLSVSRTGASDPGRTTAYAVSRLVNTFVTDPIPKTVSGTTASPVVVSATPKA